MLGSVAVSFALHNEGTQMQSRNGSKGNEPEVWCLLHSNTGSDPPENVYAFSLQSARKHG